MLLGERGQQILKQNGIALTEVHFIQQLQKPGLKRVCRGCFSCKESGVFKQPSPRVQKVCSRVLGRPERQLLALRGRVKQGQADGHRMTQVEACRVTWGWQAQEAAALLRFVD